MKKSSLLIAASALLCLSLTQCVVAPAPGPAYYGGGYGVTGRVAANAMWAGVAAYGIHERNEIRRDRIDHRNDRVNHAVNHHHNKPSKGGGHPGGGKPRRR